MLISILFTKLNAASYLYNEYAYLQEITFELYTDDIPAYKVPEQLKSIEETLMFEVLHATWKDKHWVAYTLNKNLLGTYKVGQPALADNGNTKKIYFVAAFPGSYGGLDLYTAEYKNGTWSKPRNLGSVVNTDKNESNPGLLNDNTLTYSSGGIIKKLDLKTFKVVDLEETVNNTSTQAQNAIQNKKDDEKKEVIAAIGDNSTAKPNTGGYDSNVGAIGDNSSAMPVISDDKPVNEGRVSNTQTYANSQPAVVKEKAIEAQQTYKNQANNTSNNVVTETKNVGSSSQNANVQSLGTQSRDAMIAKYNTAIQLGAFSTPKWDLIQPLSKYGKIVTYKNEKGANVVWITGFANRAAAESVLPQIKSTAGFENAYVTGK